MNLATSLPTLLGLAWLLPLASFVLIVFFGPRMGKHGKGAAYLAVRGDHHCLVCCRLISLWSAGCRQHPAGSRRITARQRAAADGHRHRSASHADANMVPPRRQAYFGDWYTLVAVGKLKITIGYYIDALTVAMFCMVTLIASCIHFYAIGYMHDELHEVTDHEVTLSDGHHLHRRGRFHRFFQYLSLFCFSMLGLVIAGNIAMVFVFWELVGICSYFLIGFYIERKSASTAANKAFIVNRVGDFGMIIGLMALFGSLGTFAFGDDRTRLCSKLSAARQAQREHSHCECLTDMTVRHLLVVAGLGIFCGCVGKSAQFPLHVWLPDAMEGPTPVSALVHSATMVAAGVYLVGRFYPVFTPEVLLVIAYIGCITLFIAATIAHRGHRHQARAGLFHRQPAWAT